MQNTKLISDFSRKSNICLFKKRLVRNREMMSKINLVAIPKFVQNGKMMAPWNNSCKTSMVEMSIYPFKAQDNELHIQKQENRMNVIERIDGGMHQV